MTQLRILAHEFVQYIPDTLSEGVLYVSVPFDTLVHKCCCGCGNEVVTPLDPNDWQMTYDGKSISLHPSIGNWAFECQSHYWIRRSQVVWAPRMSEEQIAWVRTSDRLAKAKHFGGASGFCTCLMKEVRSLAFWKYLWRHFIESLKQ